MDQLMAMNDKDWWTGTGDPLLTTAGAWLVRVLNDELSVDEIAQWQQWLAAKPEHRAVFERMQALWHGFEKLPNRVPPSAAEAAADDYTGDVSVARWQAEGESAANVPARERPAYVRGFRFSRLAASIAAMAVIVIGAVGAGYVLNASRLVTSHATTVFETAARENRQVPLPDGSQLALGAKSLAWIRFGAQEREVVLDRGEAFFTVSKDPARPFVVRAGGATITAVGTAFNVRRAGERVQVAVAEGAVKVQPPSGGVAPSETQVRAGQQMIMEPSANAASVLAVVPESVTAWRSGRLEYLDEPLKYVVADVNRYSERQIMIGDPFVGELRLTGTVFPSDIDAWLKSVEDLLPVTVEQLEPGTVVLARRAGER